MAVDIKTLSTTHLSAALELCREAGWNQLETDWRRLIAYEPDGCFGAFQREKLVGTVTTTTYDRRVAWIGMMLVDPQHRRQGIASMLMERAIGWLREQAVACIKLDATPIGEFVYSRLGFEEEWSLHRWLRNGSTSSQRLTQQPARLSLSAQLLRLDHEAFGVDRNEFLKLLQVDSATVVRDNGFGMIRAGYLAGYIGPVCAATSTAADSIVRELVESSDGDLFWDIPGPNKKAEKIARDFGFTPVRTLKRMRLGTPDEPTSLSKQYALGDPATG